MWLTDGQSQLYHFWQFRTHFLTYTEIGVALTSFGAAFMLLGVVLFFDGALLALGNVRTLFHLIGRLFGAYLGPDFRSCSFQVSL